MTRGEARVWRDSSRCAICGTTDDLVGDHDHDTGRVRDTLCQRHNRGLGFFHDSVEELLAAAAYLDLHRSASSCVAQVTRSGL